MSQFTFSRQDILNSDLHHEPAGHSLSYRIDTTTGFLRRKTTSLVPMGYGSSHRIPAAIHWKRHTFEIGGVTRDWSTLKHKTGGIVSTAREWRWSGQSYTVKFHHSIWTASSNSSSRLSIVATFSPYKYRFFSSSEPGYISFSPDVSQDDMVFLILVMIYSETKRLDSQRASASSAAAAGASASASASASAGAAC